MNEKIVLDGLSVCIGMPCSRDIPVSVVRSLFATRDICGSHGVPCSLAIVSGNAVIQWARDEVMALMLKSQANRFFMIDSDIVWKPEDFMRLLALSQKRDVICVSYPAKKEPTTFFIRRDESKKLVPDKYGLLEVQGAGLGFTVITREVAEAVSESSEDIHDEISGTTSKSIFKIGSVDGHRRGEDMAFFDKISELGYKVFLDPTISLGHVGPKTYEARALEALMQCSPS